MKLVFQRMLIGVLLIFSSTFVSAEDLIYTGWFSNKAAGGYDVVAYHTEGQPVKGVKSHKIEWKGATWLFSNANNLKMFEEEPEKYAPQYGGYCAYAVAEGTLAKGDPKHWKIVDGRLYLNYNASIQEKWEKDIPGYLDSANGNWPQILK